MSCRILDETLSLLGSGASLPGPAVTIDDLACFVRRLHGDRVANRVCAVAQHMGIAQRHFCRELDENQDTPRPGDTNPELCGRALEEALREARLASNDLGYVIGHTTSPHTLLPPNIAWVADRIGYDGPYAELRQACTGFADALQLVAGMLHSPDARPVAIVGSETGSILFDPRRVNEDSDQLVNMAQMGDGAGAVVIGPDRGQAGPTLSSLYYGSLGHGLQPGLSIECGGTAQPRVGGRVNSFRHDFAGIKELGPRLFRTSLQTAADAGVVLDEVDWFLPHQINGRVDEVLAPMLGLPREKIVVTADRFGNQGSAAIWVALHWLRTSGKLHWGDRVLALGAESTKYLYGGFIYTHWPQARDARQRSTPEST